MQEPEFLKVKDGWEKTIEADEFAYQVVSNRLRKLAGLEKTLQERVYMIEQFKQSVAKKNLLEEKQKSQLNEQIFNKNKQVIDDISK